MKATEQKPEAAMKQIQKIFAKRGAKALRIAEEEMLQETVESREAKEAIAYFMVEFWHDLARPTLLSMACEAVGGNREVTTPVAVPMILLSGAISIHDDIIDQTKTKSGYATVYGKFGKDLALLIGDALLFKGFSLVNTLVQRGLHAEKVSLISGIIKKMFFELGDAEAMELKLRGRLDVLPEVYLKIIERKAADVEAHTRIGAILGGGSDEEIEAMGRYGRILGMMIILRDDWIDLMDFGESRHRLKKESLPIPVLYGLQTPEVRSKLRHILVDHAIGEKDAQIVLQAIDSSKAKKMYEALMSDLAERANSELRLFESARVKLLKLLVNALLPPSIELE